MPQATKLPARVLVHVPHRADVGSGGEGAVARAGEDDGADFLVGAEIAEHGDEVAQVLRRRRR